MFTCTKCDAQFSKWAGRCSECQGWGTLNETDEIESAVRASGRSPLHAPARGVLLTEETVVVHDRLSSGEDEVDRVLGGGIVPGSLILLSGEPGVGKSTLVAQIATFSPSLVAPHLVPSPAHRIGTPHPLPPSPSSDSPLTPPAPSPCKEQRGEGEVKIYNEKTLVSPPPFSFGRGRGQWGEGSNIGTPHPLPPSPCKEQRGEEEVKIYDEKIFVSPPPSAFGAGGGDNAVPAIARLERRRGVRGKQLTKGEAEAQGGEVLYISGEESASQLASRFKRLEKKFDHVKYLEVQPVETIISTIEKEKPTLAIIDSIQTVDSLDLEATAGSPNLVRYATNLLLQCAKHTNVPIMIIGQVTKDGSIAGPKTLEHLVDVVLSLEGDPVHAFRILRATKNRFGSTDEVGVFEMAKNGLVAVPNPSERFLAERQNTPGSVITAILEGSRVFLVEVQALVEKSFYPSPVRRASGFDVNRLQMLSAILSSRAGANLGDKDIYVNVIGGMELNEPAADLAVCAAILSAVSNKTNPEPTVYFGEVGLGGEVRSVLGTERRLKEAERVGLKQAITPAKIKSVREL